MIKINTPIKDHLGNTYPSIYAMCKHYNIDSTVFLYRINTMKLPLENALTDPRIMKPTSIKCTDHLGNEFSSKIEMCDYWRVPRVLFFRRIRDGWSVEKALTEPVKHIQSKTKKIHDHKNNAFDTIDQMCEYYNISKAQYMKNIRNNCSVEEALTTKTNTNECKDHLGNCYNSINEMCRAYNITKTKLRSRIELGWTLKEILENPSKKCNYSKIKDHNGKEFDNMKAMCQYHGVTEPTFKHRRNAGLPLDKCLSPENQHVVKCTDHLGNQFDTIFDMCKYWNISTTTFYGRQRKLKWPLEKTLTTIPVNRYNTFGPNLQLVKPIRNDYYEIIFNNERLIWSKDKIYDYYHNHIDCPKER